MVQKKACLLKQTEAMTNLVIFYFSNAIKETLETNLSHNLHYKKTSTETVTHKQLQGHMVDGILLCTLNTYYYVCPVNSMSSGDAGDSIIGNYFTDNYLMLQDVPIALNVLFVVVFNGYSRCTNISTTPRSSVAEWSARWTHNPVVLGTSHALATCRICSWSSWVQILSHTCK